MYPRYHLLRWLSVALAILATNGPEDHLWEMVVALGAAAVADQAGRIAGRVTKENHAPR